ncbi:hypothetical protein [Flavobacterium haoranii]|uniref:Tetratricopeptide repeat-containing protein n=3 Tax=Flavobacterium haoranii TaxID=683124 RepID=A0A1M6JZD7_9FLAO|nr:hypothetical protein [Flavobacterium haoranii]SHJ52073.1 hypothetical protein SAMN05444337_2141 [Flavobacterium haoranii]
MTRIITFIALLIVSMLSAQNKLSNFEEAVTLFNQNETAQAKVLFQNEVKKETENWLPYYYLSLMNATQALENRNDLVKMKAFLEAAQKNQDKINKMQPENAEVLLTQALINTGWIVFDPFEFGQRYSLDVEYIFQKATQLAPNNPRVVLQKTMYNMGKAQYFGQDTSEYCKELEHAIELFATFKPESKWHPSWGLPIAQSKIKQCKN